MPVPVAVSRSHVTAPSFCRAYGANRTGTADRPFDVAVKGRISRCLLTLSPIANSAAPGLSAVFCRKTWAPALSFEANGSGRKAQSKAGIRKNEVPKQNLANSNPLPTFRGRLVSEKNHSPKMSRIGKIKYILRITAKTGTRPIHIKSDISNGGGENKRPTLHVKAC